MTTITHELSTLRDAIESRDAGAVTAHYAADATLTVLDAEHPPSRPAIYQGRSMIESYYRDVCGRNISHEVSGIVSSDQQFSFVQHCRYPGGEQVVCLSSATVDSDGLITTQLGIQVWDS